MAAGIAAMAAMAAVPSPGGPFGHSAGPSFWLGRPGPPEEVDVAVVGGGIVGISTAYWLARAGRRVVVLEADALAGRASGRNAGFLMTGTAEPYTRLAGEIGEARARWLWETSRENRELLRGELLDPGVVDCEFTPEGSWIAALAGIPVTPATPAIAGSDQEEPLRASAGRLAALGFDLEWREAAEVRRASGSERLGGAIFQPRDGGLDPVRLVRGIARVSGAEVRTGVRVRAVEPGPAAAGGEAVLLVTDAGSLRARSVVLALNAYAAALVPALAGEVRPVRGQILATAPGARELPGVWYVNDGYEYLRQLPDGTVVMGGCRWTALDVETGYAETPTATVQAALESFLAEVFPRLAGRPVQNRWAGIMAFTPDGLPRFGEVPGVPGAIYAAGFNGHGMSLGFLTGRRLARWACGEAGEPGPPLSTALS